MNCIHNKLQVNIDKTTAKTHKKLNTNKLTTRID